MNCGRKWLYGLSCFMLVAGAVGCGPDKNNDLAMMTEERDRLRADLDKAQAELAAREAAGRDAGRAGAQSEIDSLRSQLLAAQRDAQSARDAARSAQASGQTPEGWTSSVAGFDMISIQGEVLFDSGKATLRPAGRSTLDRIASDIQGRYGNHDIYVFGHTDTDPIKKSGWKDNWELGAERSLTIVRYLVGKGIPPQNVIVSSCGEFRPRESNKQKNRRVEFYAVDRARNSGPRTASALRAGE